MTRRYRKSEELEISLLIKDEKFIRPPQDSQRNALINKALNEFIENLKALDFQSQYFVSENVFKADRNYHLQSLSGEELMEDWQIPLMHKMVEQISGGHGDILEIGFGRGIASEMIQNQKVKSHTIIECNDTVVDHFHKWRATHSDQDIRLVHGLWQDTIDGLDLFDGIFFHTYPLNLKEYIEYVDKSATFAEHFFSYAAAHLKKNGVFTYLSNEIDSLSRAHQRSIFKYFSSFSAQVVNLDMPARVTDMWWAKSMVVIKVIK
ncbi:MAG: class I SAM-dependent methyltransferase [Saprospiraceae bacterium]